MEQTEASAFEQWLAPARPKAKIWRFLVGLVVASVVYTIFALGVMVAGSLFLVRAGENSWEAVDQIVAMTTIPGLMIALLSFVGFWLGVWAAVWLMHRQNFWTIVSPKRRIIWREFAVGGAIVVGYQLLSAVISLGLGVSILRTELSLLQWGVVLAPLCVLVFFQACGEELLFRGYLTQQLAARFGNPLVWALLPSLAFGLIHYANGTFPAYSFYYVVATTLFAFVAVALVWRTGGLSAAMGMHTVNNILALAVLGPDEGMATTQIWQASVDDSLSFAPLDLLFLALVLAFVLSPWAPFPKRQLFGRRNEIRAAP